MCDVHFIPESRDVGPLEGVSLCSLCSEQLGDVVVYLHGRMDNGDPAKYRFAYHPDCEEGMYDDLDAIEANEGCFTFGTPARELP